MTHEGIRHARIIRLAYQYELSLREAREYRAVGAMRAYRHWAQRAERLAYRLRNQERVEE